jgi:hypothetical protein
MEARFRRGESSPIPRTAARHRFSETESVYLRYRVKYSENWIGSGRDYHPHEFHILTNEDDDYVGPSHTHLTLYVEHNYRAGGGIPIIGFQDGKNIDPDRVDLNLTAVSERRATAGCNGDPKGDRGDCYVAGGRHNNGRFWRAPRAALTRARFNGSREGWHTVEAYFQLNSIVAGKGYPDGIAQYWLDGQLLIDRRNVLFRTGEFPEMKFRHLLFAPYIGDGSPVDQSAWYDDILVMTGRPEKTHRGKGSSQG